MMTRFLMIICLPALCVAAVAETLPDFRLLDQNGKSHTIRRYVDMKSVAIMAVPLQDAALQARVEAFTRLAELNKDNAVQFFLVAPGAVPRGLGEQAGTVPVLGDTAQVVLPAIGLTQAYACVLADVADWSVTYRGGLDGLEAALAGKAASSAVDGPALALDTLPTNVSYARDVAPILAAKCVGCHSEGNVGPFSMDSHRRVATRANMISETLLTNRMPPWRPDPRFGHFSNDMGLTRDETRTLLGWIASGAEKDGETDPLTEIKPSNASEWHLGTPDLVIKLPKPQEIPAEGVLDYRYVEVPIDLAPGTWVRGTEIRVTQPQVMHHVLVYLREPGQDIDFTQEYIASYVPGHDVGLFPDGTGKRVPENASLLFQLHYTPNGTAVTDTPELGIYLCKEPPKQEVFLGSAVNRDFKAEANNPESEANATFRAKEDIVIYSLSPHMHYRGSRMSFEAIYPDGNREMLLSVPDYDFYWQHSYHLAEPKRLPKGTIVAVNGAFDNSVRNPLNPDPSRPVWWGDQSTDEMFIGTILYRAAD